MSENLKKLRKERPEITTYPEQYRRSMRKIVETARQKYEPYNTLSGIANIEELERKVAEARKEEERLNEELRKINEEMRRSEAELLKRTEPQLREFRKRWERLLQDEEKAIKEYEEMIIIAKLAELDYEVFERILRDEKEHLRLLKTFY